MIEGLYDSNAAAQGKPSVRWFLGYDADGAPQFCGLPAHHTCPHRMDCSRCGLFIGGEQARLVHDDPNLLRVTAEIPMTEVQRLLNEGQREAAAQALAAAKEVPPPVPPSVAFLTNPAGLSDAHLKELADLATEDALAQLTLVADDLIATLAERRNKDGSNVAVTALRQRLAFVHSSSVAGRTSTSRPRVAWDPGPGPILYKDTEAGDVWHSKARPVATPVALRCVGHQFDASQLPESRIRRTISRRLAELFERRTTLELARPNGFAKPRRWSSVRRLPPRV